MRVYSERLEKMISFRECIKIMGDRKWMKISIYGDRICEDMELVVVIGWDPPLISRGSFFKNGC